MHVVEALVDAVKSLGVGDKLVDLEGTLHVVCDDGRVNRVSADINVQRELTLNDARQLSPALDSTEGRTLPYSTSHKLEPKPRNASQPLAQIGM